MKTPDEIKKALECCFYESAQCRDCPYYPITCDRELVRDAREYIRQLEAERDASVEDMTKIVLECGEPFCEYCERNDSNDCAGRCWTHNEGFVWRGIQKED